MTDTVDARERREKPEGHQRAGGGAGLYAARVAGGSGTARREGRDDREWQQLRLEGTMRGSATFGGVSAAQYRPPDWGSRAADWWMWTATHPRRPGRGGTTAGDGDDFGAGG